MGSKTKNYLKLVSFPIAFLVVFTSLWAAWKLLGLPPQNELVEIARRYFDLYGYWLVFVSAFIEGMLLVGWYYPGSLVIFLGVIFAGKNIPEVIWVVGLVTVGLFLAYLFNYALGKYGWYRVLSRFGLREPIKNAQTRLTKYGLSGIFLSYWQPNLAALTSTAAGVLQFPLRKFMLYSITAAMLWNIFWGALVYFLGEVALTAIGMRFATVAIVVWILYRSVFNRKQVTSEIPAG